MGTVNTPLSTNSSEMESSERGQKTQPSVACRTLWNQSTVGKAELAERGPEITAFIITHRCLWISCLCDFCPHSSDPGCSMNPTVMSVAQLHPSSVYTWSCVLPGPQNIHLRGCYELILVTFVLEHFWKSISFDSSTGKEKRQC